MNPEAIESSDYVSTSGDLVGDSSIVAPARHDQQPTKRKVVIPSSGEDGRPGRRTGNMVCCHGERPPREMLVDAVAAMRVELDQVVAGGLTMGCRLVEIGYLLPGSSPTC